MVTWRGVVTILLALAVSGCGMFGGSSSGDTQTTYQTDDPYHYRDPKEFNPRTQSTNDPSGAGLLTSMFIGGGNGGGGAGGGGSIGVNSFLWRASLDTVRFMPLASADPFGGVIITDWYSPPDTPSERFKVNIYILGRELRADGVRASVFHQKRDPGGQWIEASVDANTGTNIENAILTRAREMRLSTAQK